MKNINFSLDYFLNVNDGNLTLKTTELRIQDSVKFLEDGVVIVLEDLKVKVTTEDELRGIIEEQKALRK